MSKFEQTDKVSKLKTEGCCHVYEMYLMKSLDNNNVAYDVDFDRKILKYGITIDPEQRYGSGHMKEGNHVRMNVLHSGISRGEAYYLESLYAMQYAEKYGSFPRNMSDRNDDKWGDAWGLSWRDNEEG